MSLCHRVVKFALAVVLGGLVVITGAQAASTSTDHGDIWWNPSENGWGMNMVQTGSYIFATLYVYGTDGRPTWYVADLDYVESADNYSGSLYATIGPYFGGPFNPASFAYRQAGTMTFTALTVFTGTLSYVVDGVAVNKAIERQPLTSNDYGGAYDTQSTMTITNCKEPTYNGVFTLPGQVTISQTNGAISATLYGVLGSDTCTIPTTTYTQKGRMGRFAGSYSCPWGETGTAAIYEMNPSFFGFSARMTFDSPNFGCQAVGEIVGVIPR
jgi:hypothetical protein